VIKEDPKNEDVLYVGTDNGLYVSINRGKSWEAFSKNLPNVAVHDLVIQPKAKHLVIGTHGRSIYRADISTIQEMTSKILEKDQHVFAIPNTRYSSSWGRSRSQWRPASIPSVSIPFYVKKGGAITVSVYKGDALMHSEKVTADAGYNELSYDLSISNKDATKGKRKAQNGKYYLTSGTYKVTLGNASSKFEIKGR
jgi:ligand-binding sensor domain-containing protein